MSKDSPPSYWSVAFNSPDQDAPPKYGEHNLPHNTYSSHSYLPQANVPIAPLIYGRNPQLVYCPYCHQESLSKVVAKPNEGTHIIAALLCLLGGIPCCLLPYCIESCQDMSHYCPNCSAYLGAYSENDSYQPTNDR